jgi:hypothetical protein
MRQRNFSRREDTLARLCRQYQVDIQYVFGSRTCEVQCWLEGETEALPAGPSDVDIGVKPARGAVLAALDKVRLAVALEDLFGVSRVDLVVLPEADPFVAANVIRGERLFAAHEYRADEYDVYVLRRAGDLAPLERERMELILKARNPSGGSR